MSNEDMQSSSYPLVDLLQASPGWRVDPQALDTALVFCFSGSTTGGLFADTLGAATLPPSSWDPQGFAQDLFVERFVRDCLAGATSLVTIKHLTRLIAHPPRDTATIALRRGVLEELAQSSELLAQVQRLHQELLRFRSELEGTGQHERWDIHRKQLDILAAFATIVGVMSAGFGSARSALVRLHDFGRSVTESEGFASLASLLSYDNKQATLDFRVQMGSDGRVRQLELLEVREQRENPFVNAPWRRWAAKLELLARGYRFSDGEVMARLVDAVFEGVRPYFATLVPLLGDLEFYLGAMHFKARAEAAGLSVCLPKFVSDAEPRRMFGLFNPLLLGAGVRPVPCDIQTDRHDTTLLITGPNSGGKTRLLQAVGLTQLLAQAGMFAPVREAQLSLASGLVVSLIQETYADQPEGRLGMELMRIRSLFEKLPVGAIVILDELCSGTNPSEGEEIFELVVSMLGQLGPQAYITTHFLEFAARLERERRIEALRFLQVELGQRHEPTYQFVPGVAKTSLAHHAAARLGVTGEQLMALIEHKLRQR